MHLYLAYNIIYLLACISAANSDDCDYFLAPSLTMQGVGVFAGKNLPDKTIMEEGVTFLYKYGDISHHTRHWQLDKYAYMSSHPGYATIIFGQSSIYNHNEVKHIEEKWGFSLQHEFTTFYAAISTTLKYYDSLSIMGIIAAVIVGMAVARKYTSVITISNFLKLAVFLLANMGMQKNSLLCSQFEPSTIYPSTSFYTTTFIPVGHEIFTSYGSKWFIDRGIIEVKHPDIVAYTQDRLLEVGQCISHTRIGDSQLVGAGKGVFTRRAFKEGTLIEISPVLVHSKGEVKANNRDHNVLINYVICSNGSDVSLLPIGRMGVINHGGKAANVKMEWFFWDASMATYLEKDKWSLSSAPSAELYLGYRMLRDVVEGDELLLDYGEDWEHEWERARISGARFRRCIEAPPGLFPAAWLHSNE
jgi:hypothetical protein